MTKKKFISGWNFQTSGLCQINEFPAQVSELDPHSKGIARGGGQSYGDSSLNFSGTVYVSKREKIDTPVYEDHISEIVVNAQTSIREICSYLLKTERFMQVVPGSINATIGGCIASDVHGKNDHLYGSFGNSVKGIEVLTPQGTILIDAKNTDSFRFFVAGYGLTGIILRARLAVKKVESKVLRSRVIIVNSLDELFDLIDTVEADNEYIVGWVDFSTKNDERGFVELANWGYTLRPERRDKQRKSLRAPNLGMNLVNPYSIKLYNNWTYQKALVRAKSASHEITYEDFLFPTSNIPNWNNLFGKKGFHEIQLSVQDNYRSEVAKEIRNMSRRYPIFLVGVKKVARTGLGTLSFTSPGWSIALNVPGQYITTREVSDFLKRMWELYGCRQYLTKDSALDIETFNAMYPQADLFRKYRAESKSNMYFESEMSKRLQI